jgi:hypothetical protein
MARRVLPDWLTTRRRAWQGTSRSQLRLAEVGSGAARMLPRAGLDIPIAPTSEAAVGLQRTSAA